MQISTRKKGLQVLETTLLTILLKSYDAREIAINKILMTLGS